MSKFEVGVVWDCRMGDYRQEFVSTDNPLQNKKSS